MGLPTLLELITYFYDHPLPKEADASYKEWTIEKDVPVCSPTATRMQRVYATDNPDNIAFLPPEKTAAISYQDPQTSLMARFLSATGMGVFVDKQELKGGGETKRNLRLDLCRNEKPSSGTGADARYQVFATDKIVPVQNDEDILNNHPDLPSLRPIAFDFQPAEIVAIVKNVRLDRIHYGVSDDHTRLMLFPDLTQIDRIIAFIQSPNSPIAIDRRQPLVEALNTAMKPERTQEEIQALNKKNIQDQPDQVEKNQIFSGVLTALSVVGGSVLGMGGMWLINRGIMTIQKRSLRLMEEQMEENRRLMSGEQKLPSPEERQRIFETVSEDITAKAKAGNLDPVLGREAEIARIVETLNAGALTGANVPALIGDRGVGKSAIFEGIAQMVADGKLPQYEKVVVIDIPAIVAGTGIRGSLETKLGVVKWMIENNPKTLFVMDEVHQIIGAGKTEGSSIDAAQVLKTTLARRGSNLIVGTTQAEYQKYIMTDEAFESRMTPIKIDPLTGELRAKIFQGVRDFVLDLSKQMDEKAGEVPRTFEIPDRVIEHLGNIVGGNAREVKKALGLVVSRARTKTVPGAKGTITTADVDTIVSELNVTRKALGQPLLGQTNVFSEDAFEDPKIAAERLRNEAIDLMGSGEYEAFKGMKTEKLTEIILELHPELSKPENAATFEALAERTFEAYEKKPTEGLKTDPAFKTFLEDAIEDITEPKTNPGVSVPSPLQEALAGEVLRGDKAVPTENYEKRIIEVQVALKYRPFLSNAAIHALQTGKPLPEGESLVDSRYRDKFDALVRQIEAKFQLTDAADRKGLWDEQIRERDFVVREGVPEKMLREVGDAFITKDAKRPGSPFANGVEVKFKAEAGKPIEVERYRDHMDLLRKVGR